MQIHGDTRDFFKVITPLYRLTEQRDHMKGQHRLIRRVGWFTSQPLIRAQHMPSVHASARTLRTLRESVRTLLVEELG